MTLQTNNYARLAAAIFMTCFVAACSDSGGNPEDGTGENPGTNGQSTDPNTTPDTTNNEPDTGTDPGTETGTGTEPETGTDPSAVNMELSPLPSPGISTGPSADDEPVPGSGDFHSITAFLPVNNPGPRIPVEEPVDVSLEDYLAGPLEPQVQVPPSIDPATNNPPYFDNLTDQEILAGQTLTVLYKPLDPDGGLPGMFPEELPEGSSFDDNFDGTKSFVWQPLQGDVGIREFTVVALDPLDSLYRTRHTIRIKIDMPDDPASIPNSPPRIEEFVPHTVRVNDPVVIELKGRDLNDTIPVLTIPEMPTGGTLNQHPLFEEIYVLRYVPVETGFQTIEVVSIDADDPNVTNTDSITIEVLAANAFDRAGESLRQLAANRDFMIGFASRFEFYHRPDGEIYAHTAAQEFNIVTPENSLKMDIVNPLPGRFLFADTDNVVTFAQQNGMALHGHPLVWYRHVPDWILESDPTDREVLMREYIVNMLGRYRDSIKIWDVVNEPVDAGGNLRNSVWFEAMGEEHIDIAFRQARESLPDGTLILNDYDIAVNGAKSDGFFSLVERLQLRNVPLDAIGFQLHVFSTFDQFEDVRQKFQRAADLNLDIYITELDVSFAEGSTQQDLAQQAQVFEGILSICLEQPRCKALQTWGFTDQYSWRESQSPLLFDARYQPKPAYFALQQRLAGE